MREAHERAGPASTVEAAHCWPLPTGLVLEPQLGHGLEDEAFCEVAAKSLENFNRKDT